MVYQQRDASSAEAKDLRKQGGLWLADFRRRAGLTQKELAKQLNLDYYTFFSQLENGKDRVPPNLTTDYALAVGEEPHAFAMTLICYYDPHLFAALTWKPKVSGVAPT